MKTPTLLLTLLAAGLSLLASASGARAAISYTVPGAVYSENFDSLPNTPTNANIETTIPNGWADDTTTVAGDHVSVPGWYLYHPLVLTEGGTNDHQRLRLGDGSSNVGAFYGYGTNATTDRAIGDLGSNTLVAAGGDIFLAVRLVNNSGLTLNSFTVTYDGEQWRRGNSTGLESLQFGYSTTAVLGDWNSTATYSPVAALNFSPPVVTGTDAAVIGNGAGLTADITATVTGVAWAPGADLWLRWADRNVAGNDDGLAVDNVRFSAFDPIPEPSGIALLSAAAVSLACSRRRRR